MINPKAEVGTKDSGQFNLNALLGKKPTVKFDVPENSHDLSLFSIDDQDEADEDLVYETRVSNSLHS